jgi:hypothetical protein
LTLAMSMLEDFRFMGGEEGSGKLDGRGHTKVYWGSRPLGGG